MGCCHTVLTGSTIMKQQSPAPRWASGKNVVYRRAVQHDFMFRPQFLLVNFG